jgi:RNA polymerase sigma-70 factor (ECF subfamily)
MESTAIAENPMYIKTRGDFEALFKMHYGSLCSYACNFLKDPDAAEEVVQEVMFKVWTGRETLVFDTSVKSYLFRAVRNACMNVIKHQKVREDYRSWREHTGDDTGLSQEDAMIATELEEKIREAIDRLPLGRRKVFVMSRYEGLTYPQIAGKLDISVKTVENQMGQALKTLREELKDYLPWVVLFFGEIFRG